jgi:hypothetical protein
MNITMDDLEVLPSLVMDASRRRLISEVCMEHGSGSM